MHLTADGVGLLIKSMGILSGRDLLEAGEGFRDESRRNPSICYAIMDHSAIPEENVDGQSLRTLARRVDEILEPLPKVILAIVAPNEVLFGLSRMFETLAENPRLITRVAETHAEAMAWLKAELAERGLPFRPEAS